MDVTQILAWLHLDPMVALIVVTALLGVSEVLPYLPNVESNNIIQMIVNTLKALKVKLSLKPVEEPKTDVPPQQ